jgi:periplasmic protein TonB
MCYTITIKTIKMKTEQILKSDVLDILFENRNKSYGAYTLRKFYNNRLLKALGITFLFALGLCMFTLVKGKQAEVLPPIISDIFLTKPFENIDKPEDKKIEKPKTENTQKEATKAVAMNDARPPKITVNPNVAKIDDYKDDAAQGDKKIDLPTGSLQKVGEKIGGKDTVSKFVPTEKPAIDKFTPTDVVDVMPQYPGGMKAFRKFLETNLQNPQDLEEGEKRLVQIKFVVGYDGVLKSFETVEDGGTAFNNEVIRVLKKMPNWIPGKIGTENVSVYYTIPVKFTTPE